MRFFIWPVLEDRATVLHRRFGRLKLIKMASEIFQTLSSFCILGIQKLKKYFMWKKEMISPNCGSLVCTICVPVIAISCKSNQSFIKLSMYIKYSIQPFFFRTKPRSTNKFKVTVISSYFWENTIYVHTKVSV